MIYYSAFKMFIFWERRLGEKLEKREKVNKISSKQGLEVVYKYETIKKYEWSSCIR